MKDEDPSKTELMAQLAEICKRLVQTEAENTPPWQESAVLYQTESALWPLLDLCHDGIVVAVDGQVAYANKPMAALAGLPRAEDLVGKALSEILHPGTPRAGTGPPPPAYGREPVQTERMRLQRADGRLVDTDVVQHSGGYLGKKALFLVVTDLSHVKRLVQAAIESGQRNRTPFRILEEGFAVLSHDGVITLADEKLAHMASCHIRELVGLSVVNLVDDGGRRLLTTHLLSPKPTEPHFCFEVLLRGKNGREVPVLLACSAVYTPDGTCTGYLATVTDLRIVNRSPAMASADHDEMEQRVATRTAELSRAVEELSREIAERKRVEEENRQSEERFRAVFDWATDLICIKDQGLRFTHVNRALANLLGRLPGELIGCTTEDVFDDETARHIREVDLRVFRGETIEEDHTRPVNGVQMTFHDIRVPLCNTDGDIIGLCVISRNTTHRRKTRPASRVVAREYPSEQMLATLAKARYAAPTDGIILLQGESGSGKDWLARWIHEHSNRAGGPYFSINCAALPHELAESELFGHEPGAFTGARGRKRGLLELAEGGTLLLNEIGELSLSLQAKLLSFLDGRTFLRVGGEKSISVNARLMAATHRDLEAEVADGRFLHALWYRLNVLCVEVPPLRERIEDLPILVEDIMTRLGEEMRLTEIPVIDQLALSSLSQYHWPGNVRELRNVLERALMLSEENRLHVSLPSHQPAIEDWSHKVRFPADGGGLDEMLDQMVRSACVEALRRSQGRRRDAAELLRISRTALYRHMKRLGIEGETETCH